MASDRENLKNVQRGALGGNTLISDPETVVRAQHRRTFIWRKNTQDTNASDNTAELVVVKMKRAGRVISAEWVTDVNVAAHATNTIQLTVSKRLAADLANAVVVANGLSTSGDIGAMTNWTGAAIPLVANAVTFTANSVLTFKAIKANSGTKLDAGTLVIDVEEGD